jgi:hypothetical protein
MFLKEIIFFSPLSGLLSSILMLSTVPGCKVKLRMRMGLGSLLWLDAELQLDQES